MSGTIQGFSKELTLTVKCFFGFEETLIEELNELGYQKKSLSSIAPYSLKELGKMSTF